MCVFIMNKLFIIGLLGVLLIGSVSAYYCIDEKDNEAVKEFKYNINIKALAQDIESHDLTEEQFLTKMKYFSPCR